MRRLKLIAGLACAIVVATLALAGCTASPEQDEEDVNMNGGAERSYTDEELEDHDGSAFFPTTFTFDELLEDFKCQPGRAQEGAFERGGYIVGAEGAPAPGIYALEGSQEKMGELHVYTPAEEEGYYQISYDFGYLGFALADLNEGDAVFFLPGSDTETMHVATDEPRAETEPYPSGLYRVGIDIPFGTYTVTQSEANAAVIASKAFQKPQVIVYSNLDFGEDNIVSEEYLPPFEEGPVAVEVTVQDGQFLELYGCTATRLAVP